MNKSFFFNFTMPEFKLWQQVKDAQKRKREWTHMDESIRNQRTLDKLRRKSP